MIIKVKVLTVKPFERDLRTGFIARLSKKRRVTRMTGTTGRDEW